MKAKTYTPAGVTGTISELIQKKIIRSRSIGIQGKKNGKPRPAFYFESDISPNWIIKVPHSVWLLYSDLPDTTSNAMKALLSSIDFRVEIK
jgi:hypothetical protein